MTMVMDASDSHGDANRTLEEPEENYFHPDFKEYMLKEQLKWSRYEEVDGYGDPHFGGVFWSQQDYEIEPSLSHDICANPIRDALQKIIVGPQLGSCLVQFWAATTTLEGRTFLTTQYQPFALSPRYRRMIMQDLCKYRMKMSREYNFFYADAESGEEQLGLPGRVFLHKSPECSPDVRLYSEKEYPQRYLAVSCHIYASWAVPVFEHSSHTCVGVLEMVSPFNMSVYWLEEAFLRRVDDIFQELGLQCFDQYLACEWEVHTSMLGLAHAFQELKTGLESVGQIYELPLAMAWVPCRACNGLRRCKLGSTGVEFFSFKAFNNYDFLKASKWHYLGKGLVAGRALSFYNMLYCSDITQLSLDEYPLVHYARQSKLSGWFTICLQNVYTGNVIYVLEFFLSAKSKDNENILTKLSFILGTIEEKFTTFRLASGKPLGELMPFEVINFQNDQKFPQFIQATRNFSSQSSEMSSVQSLASVANTRPGFQDANMVTIKTTYDPFFDSDPSSDSEPSFEQSTASVANTRPGFQDANMVPIKAKYASYTIMFNLSLPYRLVELQQKVTERLNLDAGTYHVRYQDELAELILIACDEDLHACVNTSILLGNTSTVVFLEPKKPVTSLNPTN